MPHVVLCLCVLLACLAIGSCKIIPVGEDMKPGNVLKSYTCAGKPSITTSGISTDFFNLTQAGSNVSLILSKKVDLENKSDFSVTRGSDCLYTANTDHKELTFYCNGSGTTSTLVFRKSDEFPPYFCTSNCSKIENVALDVKEETKAGTKLLELYVCDDDANTVVSSIQMQIHSPGTYLTYLTDSNKRTLELQSSFDYESNATVLNSFVTLNSKRLLNITITVIDSDDQGIAFTQPVFKCFIPENLHPGVTNCSVLAKDLDKGIDMAVGYELLSVTPAVSGLFELLPNGSLQMKGHIDRENTPVYYLAIKGYQTDRPLDKVDYATVLFTVTDVDDNLPRMHQDFYNASVTENSPIGTIVCQVSASDEDEGENAQFKFEIAGGNTYFEVDDSTGSIMVKAQIDRETIGTNPIKVKIQAVSVKNSAKKSTMSNVTVFILDENDNSPTFLHQNVTVSINKTQALYSSIYKANATDIDEGQNGEVRYRFENTDVPFNIDPSTGVITLTQALSETFDPLYTLVVIAQDNAKKMQLRRSSLMVVRVKVNDVNIHSPTFSPNLPTKLNISEDAEIGTTLLELQATDKDPTDNLSFSIEHGYGVFSIEGKYLKTSNFIDRELRSSYNVVVTVTDSLHVVKMHLTVKVTDINDNGPIFDQQHYNLSVTEEILIKNIGQFSANDADDGLNGEVVYEIDVGSKWSQHFTIDKTNGHLSSKVPLDREALQAGEKVTFLVFAYDRGQPERMNSTTVTVNILDINDNGPIFDNKHNIVYYEFKEGTRPTNFHNATASDADGKENNNIFYKLNEPSLQGSIVVSEDGTVSFGKTLQFSDANGCNNTCIRFTIEAYNKQPYQHTADGTMAHNSTQTVVLNIDDVNERPYFHVSKPKTDLSIPERDVEHSNGKDWHSFPALPHTFLAHDDDVFPELRKILYTLSDASGKFRFDSSSGTIIQIKDIDFDPPANETHFKLILMASNLYPLENGTEALSKLEINIKVTDVDDNPPMFTSGHVYCEVKENKTGLIEGCFVDAFDKDSGVYKKFTLSTNHKAFTVTRDGQISINDKLDYETTKQHNVTVSAKPDITTIHNVCGMKSSAHFNTSCTATCLVTINVLNVNDMPPHFPKKIYNFSIAETNETDLIIGRVSAVDHDGDINALEYSLSPKTNFDIDSDGYIRSNKALDFEQGPEYIVTVTANDTIFSDSASVHIHVLPVNEFNPIFTETFNWDVKENEIVTKNISATDYDKGDTKAMTFRASIPNQWANNIVFNNISGELTLTTIDRESLGDNNIIHFSVEVIDGGTPSRTGVAMVTVQVTGVNDNPPVYSNETKYLSLNLQEGKMYHSIFTSKASDSDIGPGSKIFYRLRAGSGTALFTIGKSSGILSSKSPLWITPSNNGSMQLEIEAFNENGTQNVAVQQVIIHLQDVNNHKPVFTKTTYSKTIQECWDPKAEILRVTASDADATAEYNTVFYWLEEMSDTFNVAPDTGSIHLTGTIDFDPPANMTNIIFNVYATDDLKSRNKSISTEVTLKITNCNDNPPVFQTDIYWCQLVENQKGDFKCSVTATDVDGDNIQYSFVDPQHTKKFVISNSTGTLTSLSEFDYDTIASKEYRINVTASDNKYSSSATVVVKILDINDERPKFKDKDLSFSIKENTKEVSYFVGEVKVTDSDSGFTLTIDDCFAACKGCFRITEKGDVMALKDFDFEDTGPNDLTCQVTANDTTTDFVKQNISITVVDINDNTPTFAHSSFSSSVNETASTGTFVVQLTAIDKDISSKFNQISYTIYGGNELGLFDIDHANGSVYTQKGLDDHFGEKVTLVIKACDNDNPPLCSYSNLGIQINNLNIHKPVFMGTPYHVQIKEGGGNKSILTIHATDKDGDELEYKVVNETTIFFFQENVLYARTLDAELFRNSSGLCYIEVQVSDGIHVLNTTVVVTIIDVNDNAPKLVAKGPKEYSLKVNDTSRIGTTIFTFAVQDDDISNNGFTFVLQGGKGDIDVDEATGDVKVINGFGKNGMIYNMTVIVMDHGDPPKSVSSNLFVEIIDTFPNFHFNGNITVGMTEESSTEQASLAVIGDNGPVDHLDYQIISENGNSIREIFNLNSSTGMLTLANKLKPLNYEQQSEYKFKVLATDHGVFQKSAVANVTIKVKDINEKPSATSDAKVVMMEEHSPLNTFITRINANDPDMYEPFNKLTYTLPDPTVFKVDQQGNIRVKDNSLKAGNYSMRITVTDGGKLTDSILIHVVVPKIKIHHFDIHLKENNSVPYLIKSLGTKVGGMTVKYKVLQSSLSGMFFVENNGSLMLKDVLDREITESITLNVNGRHNSSGILLYRITVVIYVEDINDCAPEFPLTSYTVTIDDLTKSHSTIATITAVDKDIDADNRNLTYQLRDADGLFSMDKMGKLVVENATRLKTKTYTTLINVTDGRFHNNASLTITVVDTNDHSPEFDKSVYNFTIIETNSTGVVVGSVPAFDADSGRNGNVSLSITAGNIDSAFKINSYTGILKIVNQIDREYLDKYQLIITAKDSGNSPRQGTCTVLVNVLDINDNFPKLQVDSAYKGSILENSEGNVTVRVVPEITATDPDIGVNGTAGLVYQLNDTKSPFCIRRDSLSASVFVCGDIDRELQDTYFLEVIVLDMNGSKGCHRTSYPLTIQILDENDEVPQFTQTLYRFNVSENMERSMSVGKVEVSDNDLHGEKVVKFGIAKGADGKFHIDTNTGIIYVGGKIDREKKSEYKLYVVAFDGVNKNYIEVIIDVTDANDNPPVFTIFVIDVEENKTGVIFNAKVHDRDQELTKNSKVTFSTESRDSQGVRSSKFDITKDGGLRVVSSLDRETSDRFEVTITATDNGTPPLSSSLLLYINVLDINDNHPVICVDGKCGNPKSDCHITKTMPDRSVLKILEGRDSDAGSNGTVTFTLTQSKISAFFDIGPSTGVLMIKEPKALFNFYNTTITNENQMYIRVIGMDGGGATSDVLTMQVHLDAP